MSAIEIRRNPSRRELRQFAAIWFPAFFAVVGSFVWFYSGSLFAAASIWGVAFAVSVLGYFAPSFMRPVFRGWITAAYPIGWCISHLLLAFVFYLVITPIGWVMRLVGRDPLERAVDRSADTHWVREDSDRDAADYFKQF